MDKLEKLREKQNIRSQIEALDECPFECNDCETEYNHRLRKLQEKLEVTEH